MKKNEMKREDRQFYEIKDIWLTDNGEEEELFCAHSSTFKGALVGALNEAKQIYGIAASEWELKKEDFPARVEIWTIIYNAEENKSKRYFVASGTVSAKGLGGMFLVKDLFGEEVKICG